MKTLKLIAIIGLLFGNPAYSQVPETDKTTKNEIGKLSFILGKWEGDGWMMSRDGKKMTFTQTENIQSKLDGTAILLEGLGTSAGKVIHNALAIITFNKPNNQYSFNSYLATGTGGEFKGELIDKKFYWYPNENMRYIIFLNEKGQWYETGEINRQGEWVQFFEMTLDKQ